MKFGRIFLGMKGNIKYQIVAMFDQPTTGAYPKEGERIADATISLFKDMN